MKYELICTVCGTHFTSGRWLSKYCSPECRKQGTREYMNRWKAEHKENDRRHKRAIVSADRNAEIEEHVRKVREDFEARCAAGDPRALLLRERAEHGNMSRRYWELFAAAVIKEAEESGRVSKLTVNGCSPYNDTFADDVLESVKAFGQFNIR